MTSGPEEPHSHQAIAERVRVIRDAFGLTQSQLANIVGTGASTVGNWEQARQKPTIAQAKAMGDRLGLTLDYIFLGRLGTVPVDLAAKLSVAETRSRSRSISIP